VALTLGDVRLAVVLAVAFLAAGCGGSGKSARSPDDVVAALRSAHLASQRTTIVVTLESGTTEKPPPLQYAINTPSYEEFRPRATYSVEGGRAIVYVYATEDVAAPYSAAPRSHVLVVRNVVAMSAHGTLSRRLRAALARLA
jgi:hypothetical protein